MPNLRPIQQFSRQINLLEAAYNRDLQRVTGDFRLIILDVLTKYGLGAELTLEIRREANDLRRQVRSVAANAGQSAIKHSSTLAKNQIEQVLRLTGGELDFDALGAVTAGEQQQVLQDVVNNLTTMVDQLEAQLAAEASRLRAANEPVPAAIDRLLSERIADGRVSVWRQSMNAIALNAQRDLWAAATNVAGTYYRAGESQTEQRWQKQAIAGIDERTTDCCLRVHGQTVDMDKPFHLTGTPRFRDDIQNPPFHWFCRTGMGLYIPAMEGVGVTTQEMRDAARAERVARETTGTRLEIHPANAISRRK